MKINFIDREISEGPLEVLRNLYYYTVQYGISVRQFTGEHWKYWRELPEYLRSVMNNPSKLKKVVKELQRLADGDKKRTIKRRLQFQKWREKEVVINAQLLSLMAALPQRLLGLVIKTLTNPQYPQSEFRVVTLKMEAEKRGENHDFVEPDMLFLAGKHLIMVELKTRGGQTSSRSYPPQQLLNYVRLALECERNKIKDIPNQFTHLILAPTTELKWLEHHEKWVSGSKDTSISSKLDINIDSCIRLGNPYTNKYAKDFQRFLKKIPVYYCSWGQLVNAYNNAAIKFGDRNNQPHWKRIGRELKSLAEIATKFS